MDTYFHDTVCKYLQERKEAGDTVVIGLATGSYPDQSDFDGTLSEAVAQAGQDTVCVSGVINGDVAFDIFFEGGEPRDYHTREGWPHDLEERVCVMDS